MKTLLELEYSEESKTKTVIEPEGLTFSVIVSYIPERPISNWSQLVQSSLQSILVLNEPSTL